MPSFLLFEIHFSTMSALNGETAFELGSTKVQNYIFFLFMDKNAWLATKKKNFLLN